MAERRTPRCVQRFEDLECVEFVGDRDHGEEQLVDRSINEAGDRCSIVFRSLPDTLLEPGERAAQEMLGGVQSPLRQPLQRHEVILIEAVVVAIQREFRPRYETDRIQVAEVAGAKLLRAPHLRVGRIVRRSQVRQMGYRGEHQEAERRHALLAVDDVECPVVRGLQHQVAHVVRGFRVVTEQGDDVPPQVVPLVGAPGIVALEQRHPVAEAVAHQLAEGVVGGVEVHPRNTRCVSRMVSQRNRVYGVAWLQPGSVMARAAWAARVLRECLMAPPGALPPVPAGVAGRAK